MPSNTQDRTADRADSQQGEPVERSLLRLGLDPFDVRKLGLRVSSDGVDLQLNALPEDGAVLGQVLAEATDMLEGLTGDGDEQGDGAQGGGLGETLRELPQRIAEQVRRLEDWIDAQLRRLIRWLVAKLVLMATDRLSQKIAGGGAKAKGTAGKGGQKAKGTAGKGGQQAKQAGGKAAGGGKRAAQAARRAADALTGP